MEYQPQTKNCQNCKLNFTIETDDFSFYEKIKVPPPTFCPECRMMRRMIWRNYRFLTKGPDAVTGKEIFMCIPPESGIPVYEFSYWNSDNWDATSYGKDYDFSKPFFTQYKELFYSVPFPAKTIQRSVDSEYSNNCDDMKNTYLCFNATFLEDCAYCTNVTHLKNSFDMTSSYNSELCYDDVRLDKSYQTVGSIMSENCVNVWFSKNCVGCNNCLGCVNLRNMSYCIYNEQYSKEEYLTKIESFKLDTWEGYSTTKEKSESFWVNFPIKYMLGSRNYNVLGEDIRDSKNAINCYSIKGGENLKYVQDAHFGGATDSYDFTSWGLNVSQLYECLVCGENLDQLKFCYNCYPECRELDYCIQMRRSKNCFGCVSLRDKQYCIFNKQYTKEEYFKLREQLIKHMNDMPYIDTQGLVYKYGEFFPIETCPFAYNETTAQEFFPLTREEAISRGYSWREEKKRNYQITIQVNNLPKTIVDTPDSIVDEIISCEHEGNCNEQCTSAFKIVPAELQFYRRMNLPLPKICPNCRNARRLKFRNPMKLWPRKCMNAKINCLNEFETSYSPERPEIVYCEKCYQAEVY